MISPSALAQIMDDTWPAAEMRRVGPWMIRSGLGGGKRVCAATVAGAWTPADIPLAVDAMHALDQTPLFLIGSGDMALDAALDHYHLIDPVTAYSALLEPVLTKNDTCFPHWPPLAIAARLWADAGIGPARIAVMHRAMGPKTAILARGGDRAAGVCFAAMSGKDVMIHALEVALPHRRQGSAQMLLRAAARWAAEHGAARLSLVVTTANTPARTLYEKIGMQVVGAYHYRQFTPETGP
jgi:GNAT superfamily N-acetyltransferase